MKVRKSILAALLAATMVVGNANVSFAKAACDSEHTFSELKSYIYDYDGDYYHCKCSYCDEEFEFQHAEVGHTEDLSQRKVVITKEATCSSKGLETTYKYCYCSNLIEVSQKDIDLDPDNHTWDDGKVTKEATSSEEGVLTYTCTGCQETYDVPIPKLTGQDVNITFNYYVKTPNTDYVKQWKTVSVTKNYPAGYKIEKLQQDFYADDESSVDEVFTKYPSLNVSAQNLNYDIYDKYCAVSWEKIEPVSTTEVNVYGTASREHTIDIVSYEIVDPATCTERGIAEKVTECTNCHIQKTAVVSIDPLGHDYDYDNGIVYKEATYDEEGEIWYPCKNGCGEYDVQPIAKLKDVDINIHYFIMDENDYVDPASDSTNNFTQLNYVKTISVGLPEDYTMNYLNGCFLGEDEVSIMNVFTKYSSIAPSFGDLGIIDDYCWIEDCKLVKPVSLTDVNVYYIGPVHTYDDGTVLKKPTVDADGYMGYYCYNCEHTKYVTLDKLTIDAEKEITFNFYVTNEDWYDDPTDPGDPNYDPFSLTLSYTQVNGTSTAKIGLPANYTVDELDYFVSAGEPLNFNDGFDDSSAEVAAKLVDYGIFIPQTSSLKDISSYQANVSVDPDKICYVKWFLVKAYDTNTVNVYGYIVNHEYSSTGEVVEKIEPGCVTYGSETTRYYCTHCHDAYYDVTNQIRYTGHTAAETKVQENYVAPTCTEDGHYDMVRRCTKCGEIISSTPYTIEKTGHTEGEPVRVDITEPTCYMYGEYQLVYYCEVCHEEIRRETFHIDPTGNHTAADPVKENEVPATCTVDGSYDLVTYCSVCHEELSREKVTIEASHTAGDPKIENVIAPTCIKDGSFEAVIYCTVCGEELSRTKITVLGTATGHTEGDVVIENEIAPTCIEAGSYDKVVYCEVCGVELSREKVILDALGHDFSGDYEILNRVEPTVDSEGGYDKVWTCTHDGCTVTKVEHVVLDKLPAPSVTPSNNTTDTTDTDHPVIIEKLPQTGGFASSVALPIAGGVILILSGVVVFIISRKKRNNV